MATATVSELEDGTGSAKGRTTKVEQYSWKIKDEPGIFDMIPKDKLNIDGRYQRSTISKTKIAAIRQNWSWLSLGVLIVAMRKDGTLWVVDGQHRKLAADYRADIRELPCLVFEVEEVIEEAMGFIAANTVRGPVTFVDKFNAMVLAGDKTAQLVKQTIESSGYKVASTKGRGGGTAARFVVSCVGAAYKLFDKHPEFAGPLWKLIVELFNGEPITTWLVDGLAATEEWLRKNDETLLNQNNRQALARIGVEELERAIHRARAFYAKGGERIYACGIIAALNKGRRTRKLPEIAASQE